MNAAALQGAKRRPGRPPGEQRENADKRRRQIIEATIDSIVEHGMSATTLATVSKAAGLSQGAAIFYFQTKENLLVATLRAHYEDYQAHWTNAVLGADPHDPIERLCALVLAEMDPEICNPRTLALWNSFWGEASARPRFAEICDYFDKSRTDYLMEVCAEAAPLAGESVWTAESIADVLDMITDGLWTRLHISPDYLSTMEARALLARLMAGIFPAHKDQIVERAGVILE